MIEGLKVKTFSIDGTQDFSKFVPCDKKQDEAQYPIMTRGAALIRRLWPEGFSPPEALRADELEDHAARVGGSGNSLLPGRLAPRERSAQSAGSRTKLHTLRQLFGREPRLEGLCRL